MLAAAGLLQLVVVDILLTRSVQVGQQPCWVLKNGYRVRSDQVGYSSNVGSLKLG